MRDFDFWMLSWAIPQGVAVFVGILYLYLTRRRSALGFAFGSVGLVGVFVVTGYLFLGREAVSRWLRWDLRVASPYDVISHAAAVSTAQALAFGMLVYAVMAGRRRPPADPPD